MLLTIIGVIVVLIVIVVGAIFVGLQIKPRPFPDYPARTPPQIETVPVPDDLPEPVARFYDVITQGSGAVPVIESAVLTGRADMRLNGVPFKARFRFVHDAGDAYRHYIEATTWNQPLLKINERYLDGESLFELPFGTTEDDPQVNQGANLALWGEAMWFPSIFVTDPRARWEPVDEHTAHLIVPFGDQEETFTAVFDAETGLLDHMTAMRYKGEDASEKTLWTIEPRGDWIAVQGMLIPESGAVIWADEDGPWAVFTLDDAVYNVDVSTYIRQKGL